MKAVCLQHAEERLLPLLEAELRVLRERSVDVAADHLHGIYFISDCRAQGNTPQPYNDMLYHR